MQHVQKSLGDWIQGEASQNLQAAQTPLRFSEDLIVVCMRGEWPHLGFDSLADAILVSVTGLS